MEKFIEKYWVQFIIVILGTNLIIRMINQSQLIYIFPFDFVNDLSAYLGQLHFLQVCGFHNWCPYWYNGFYHLVMSPPGWYFFAYPLYLFTGNTGAAMYLSMILLLIAGYVSINTLGKKINLTSIKRLAFFLLFFANASSIGNFIRNGRQHAMLATVLFTIFFYIIWIYKDKKLNYKFVIASSVIYSSMIVTHYQETVLAAFFFLSLFIYKKTIKDRAMVVGSFVLSIILSLWWTIDFIKNAIISSPILDYQEGTRILLWSKDVILTNIMTLVIPIILLGMWYTYYKHKKIEAKKDIIIFLPFIVLAVVYLFRLIIFIPILRNISQDPYIMFFLFIMIFMFFKEEEVFIKNKKFGTFLHIIIIVGVIMSVAINIVITPFFIKNVELDKEVMELFSDVNGTYIMYGDFMVNSQQSYSKAYYSYGSIYHNASTSSGWSPPLSTREYMERIEQGLTTNFKEGKCEKVLEELDFFNTTEIISTGEGCKEVAKCGLRKVKALQHACLYTTN